MSAVAKAGTLSFVPLFDADATEQEPRYIANRTHCKDYTSWVPWIKEFEFTTAQNSDEAYEVAVDLDSTDATDGSDPVVKDQRHTKFVVGDTYKVTFDGGVYYCKAFQARTAPAGKLLAVGDSSVAKSSYSGGDNGVPFLFVDRNGTLSTVYIYTSEAGIHTVSIERVLYRTIDPRFIADEQRADKLPTFDISIENVDGKIKTYRMYGYEVK